MFDATRLLQTLTDALSLGSLYALIAIGYTMVYGVLRLINFAHGEIFMIAMYIVFYGISMFSLPWYVTFAVTILVTALLGTLAERLAYRPLRNAPRISILISAIGVSYFLQNLATVLFGGRPLTFPQIPLFTDVLVIGDVYFQRLSLIVPVIAAVLSGIGNTAGAVLGGLMIGFIEIVIVALFPALSGYRDAFAFVVLILVLLVKPTGLLGEKTTEKV